MPAVLSVLIQYCNDPRPDRMAEYDECVRRNLANPHVKAVHNLVETGIAVPAEFTRHPRYVEHRVADWLTYRAAFDYANAALVDEIVALLNLDIFLDPDSDWPRAEATLRGNRTVFCQARTEYSDDGSTHKDPAFAELAFATTQDAWVFKTPIHVVDCDFEIGTLGCDNAIADRLVRSGYIPVNAPNQFRILHYDRVRQKTAHTTNATHIAERGAGSHTSHPERAGQYLVPDYETFQSVDKVLDLLNVSELARYSVICDVFSKFIKIDNS
jgi:hypothetical protein